MTPDLTVLVADAEPRIRRRAALAIGRVGLPEGGAALQPLLADPDPEVRQMAAFALGLLADKTAVPALTAALQDADPRVRGRAAEALGLIGDTGSAAAVGQMVSALRRSRGRSRRSRPDEEQSPKTPEADAVRLGLFALVRLKGYEPLAAAVQDRVRPRVATGGRSPSRCSGSTIRAPFRRCTQLARSPGVYTRAFAARGLGGAKDAARDSATSAAMLEQARGNVPVTVSAIRALAQIGGADAAARNDVHCTMLAGREDRSERAARGGGRARRRSRAQPALPYIQDLLDRRLAGDARGGGARRGRDRSRGLPHRALGHGAGSALERPRRDRRRARHDGPRGRASSASARCSTTRTSASSRRRSTAWSRLKAPGLEPCCWRS